MNATTTWICWLFAAYLSGSIPFGLIVGRAKGKDIRKHGSGNIGATNVGRVFGTKWGAICFTLDVLKGMLPVLAYKMIVINSNESGDTALATIGWMTIAAATILGHIFPIWLKFKGGKGVATGLGALLGLWPVMTLAGVLVAALWFVVVYTTGYVSLGSIIAVAALPLLVTVIALTMNHLAITQLTIYITLTTLLAAVVILRHKSNITRLRTGTENKVSWSLRK